MLYVNDIKMTLTLILITSDTFKWSIYTDIFWNNDFNRNVSVVPNDNRWKMYVYNFTRVI